MASSTALVRSIADFGPGCRANIPVHDRCDLAAVESPRLADADRRNTRDGVGSNGDGKPNVMGVVYRRNIRHRDRIRRAADRGVGAGNVWSMTEVSQQMRGLATDTLFVGATRPPMRWGVTFSALLFNLVFTMELFLLTRNLLMLLVAAPIHGVSALLCARDARYFDLLLLWGRTRLPALLGSLRYWKASSYSPLELDIPSVRGARRRRDLDLATLRVCYQVRSC